VFWKWQALQRQGRTDLMKRWRMSGFKKKRILKDKCLFSFSVLNELCVVIIKRSR
jgi:hypothetical protein